MKLGSGLVLAAMTGGLVACSLDSVDRGVTIVVSVPGASSLISKRSTEAIAAVGLTASPLPPPSAVSGFDCLGVNVTGPGIPDTSPNPDLSSMDFFPRLLARESYCSYRGILAGPVSSSVTGAQEVALVVPAGSTRLM